MPARWIAYFCAGQTDKTALPVPKVFLIKKAGLGRLQICLFLIWKRSYFVVFIGCVEKLRLQSVKCVNLIFRKSFHPTDRLTLFIDDFRAQTQHIFDCVRSYFFNNVNRPFTVFNKIIISYIYIHLGEPIKKRIHEDLFSWMNSFICKNLTKISEYAC